MLRREPPSIAVPGRGPRPDGPNPEPPDLAAVGRLYHFSDDPTIAAFEPQPVRVPSEREPGMEWLNEPLVWAVDEQRQACYCFPRDCPRIMLWLTPETTSEDRERWWGRRDALMIAHIERSWFEAVTSSPLYRYELPPETFEAVGNQTWVQVSRERVVPLGIEAILDPPAELRRLGVELRVMESLLPLKGVWDTSLHASGFRMRNARDWG